ncbi:MAG: 3-methyl-2-oxobutanoate hydroxymethyltransferase [Bacteroidetes bacterium]|nr:3-methyl-2-oxobutanoate hydroxymethyltransferase [Bacteroidota bacterium]
MTSGKTKINIKKLLKMKRDQTPVAWITSYDLPFSYVAEQAGVDMILVGDSGGMVQLGYKTTNPVTMNEMITMATTARRGAPNTFLIGDMPQGSYEVGERDAIINSLRFIKEADCDAIKLEGGKRVAQKVKAIADAGILVMGHLGLTPQSSASFGGYRVQGKTIKTFEENLEDAFALQEAGAFAILLEAMPSEPAGQIAKQLDIPIYGIGAGRLVDGQLVIMHDLMGFYQPFRPWFAKCYIPVVIKEFEEYIANIPDTRHVGREERKDGLLVLAEMAVNHYIQDVKEKQFPGEEYSYPIKDEQLERLKKSKMWKE